jgi:hypothetical protein
VTAGDAFLGVYEFTGDPVTLLAAYERLLSTYPVERMLVHVCVTRDDGIAVYDACPTRAVFDVFSTSPEFAGALQAAGLPAPNVVPLGHVHSAVVPEAIGR